MMKRNLLTSLLLYESVRTTKKRAQVIAPEVDKLIAFAKSHSAHVAIRRLNATVTDTNASRKVMEVLTKRYAKKNSGLTRTQHVGVRVGDGAQLVDISLVEGEVVEEPKAEPKKAESKKAPAKKEATEKKAPAKKKSTTSKKSSKS